MTSESYKKQKKLDFKTINSCIRLRLNAVFPRKNTSNYFKGKLTCGFKDLILLISGTFMQYRFFLTKPHRFLFPVSQVGFTVKMLVMKNMYALLLCCFMCAAFACFPLS